MLENKTEKCSCLFFLLIFLLGPFHVLFSCLFFFLVCTRCATGSTSYYGALSQRRLVWRRAVYKSARRAEHNLMVSASPHCIVKMPFMGQKIKNLLVFYAGSVGVGTEGDNHVKILYRMFVLAYEASNVCNILCKIT